MAAKNESGADWKRGNERILSSMSNGISRMAERVKGDGLTGRAGLFSELKVRIKDTVSDRGLLLLLA